MHAWVVWMVCAADVMRLPACLPACLRVDGTVVRRAAACSRIGPSNP
jgi:hypothetical protein